MRRFFYNPRSIEHSSKKKQNFGGSRLTSEVANKIERFLQTTPHVRLAEYKDGSKGIRLTYAATNKQLMKMIEIDLLCYITHNEIPLIIERLKTHGVETTICGMQGNATVFRIRAEFTNLIKKINKALSSVMAKEAHQQQKLPTLTVKDAALNNGVSVENKSKDEDYGNAWQFGP